MKIHFKIAYELFKEKIRKFIHPKIFAENEALFLERKAFYSIFLPENSLVFDVGANLGNRVAVFLSLKNKVVAIEPQNYCFEYLKKKFAGNIILLKIALGAKKDKMIMYINSRSSTISSLSKDWVNIMKNSRFSDQEWDKTTEVNVDTLDNLILQYGIPHFIKIDVEGFETEVLKGLSIPIPILSFEYTTPEQLDKLYECLDIINTIDPKYLCNYSTGEKSKFALNNWQTIKDFKMLIAANVQAMEGFGDVYVKLPTCKLVQ